MRDKSYKIVAFRRPLTLLAIEDSIVSIRAIGCQRDIADKIIAGKRVNKFVTKR